MTNCFNPFAGTGCGVRWDIMTQKRIEDPIFLDGFGYKVYSQNDEDGIIAEIFHRIGVTNKRFIEFGVQDGIESNSHYLLFQGWCGLWIEADVKSFLQLLCKFKSLLKTGQLKVINEFVTPMNINALFENAGFVGEIDLLSIDIDGNDYHLFQAIDVVNPRVIVVEYNGKFPPECTWVMDYKENYCWDGTDRHGASLKALEKMAKQKGYQLVGTNIVGVNAFFVRKDLVKDLFPNDGKSEMLYNPARFPFLGYQIGHPTNGCLLNSNEVICTKEEVTLVKKHLANPSNLNEPAIDSLQWYESEHFEQAQIRWMKQKSAHIFLRSDIDNPTQLVLEYINYMPENEAKPMELSLALDGVSIFQGQCISGKGAICVPIPSGYQKDDVLEMALHVNQLWQPSTVSNSSDDRLLGIAVCTIIIQ